MAATSPVMVPSESGWKDTIANNRKVCSIVMKNLILLNACIILGSLWIVQPKHLNHLILGSVLQAVIPSSRATGNRFGDGDIPIRFRNRYSPIHPDEVQSHSDELHDGLIRVSRYRIEASGRTQTSLETGILMLQAAIR